MRRKLISPGLHCPLAVWTCPEPVRSAWAGAGHSSRPADTPRAAAGHLSGRDLGFASLFEASEVVCGAVMAAVVSAVFHLTHLVQWNK